MKPNSLATGFVLFASMLAHPASAQSLAREKTSSQAATKQLRAFLTKDWTYWMREYPEQATIFGYPGQNRRWTDFSPPAIERRNRSLQTSLEGLEAVPRNALPAGEQLNYDLYRKLLESAVEGLRFHDDAFPLASVFPNNLYIPITQVQGALQDVPNTFTAMPAAKASDYEDILVRLNRLPAFLDSVMALMKDGAAHGWTPPKITMRDVPKQAESQIVSDPLTSPLLAAFRAYPATFTAAQKQDFTRRAAEVYMQQVAPAFQRLADYLTETYIPACREKISISEIPGGADYYKYLVRWQTTTSLTAPEIHQIGLDQVKRIRAEMDEVILQTGFHGSFAEFVKFLNTDPRFRFSSKEELLMHYRDAAKRADPETALLIGRLPRLPYGIRAVPDAVAPSQTSAYYYQGAPEAGRPGYVYVNTYKLESRPSWDVEDTLLHEGVPGHHLQISLAQEMEGVPEFRKQVGYTAYVEGWGLYSESLGSEMGFYTDPYSKFGYLSAQMWRAVRLVVDTGMHSMEWSRDQALQYFEENTGQPEQNSIAEIDRYIVWPAQALGYMIGRLKIQELRRSAEQELGSRFEIRAFHDAVLDQGALPLDMLESQVHAWIAAQKEKRPSAE
ncbi:MAG TPA: DUF885 domain-containing protein [Candidatus Acidoferrales bacterium]|nr:DUF885 domain-containing protein [Candidatus Acidoferrales bacterium]